MIKTVTQGTLFKASENKSIPSIIKSGMYSAVEDIFYLRDVNLCVVSVELFRSFCQEVIGLVPSAAHCLLPTVTAISEKISNPTTQTFVCDILNLALSGGSTMVGDEGVWQELPFIPTDHELAGNLVEEDKHLSPVKNSYLDPESYMDTYFRLLRAETFSAIQHGIKELKDCELDERDMNVYHNIHLAGFEIQHGRFSLAVHFTPARDVKKWEASPQLMFGNLVCISLNRKFDDVIWAVVSNRDTDILNKHKIIMLELIDENTKKMSQIISSLQAHAGSGVMVESPTYYHSMSPILRSLKDFEMENFPLQREIIYARETPGLPDYLKQAETVNTKAIYKAHVRNGLREIYDDITKGEMNFRKFIEVLNIDSSTSLEASQCLALKQALMNRLAIIQGPPGCGKTYIGVKIVQLLLTLSPKLKKPILLLTYKNHALDEFLKHMLDFCSINDLVRIGSRSKEPQLETCNLQAIMRSLSRNQSYGKAMYAEIQETKDEIRGVETRIKALSSQVDSSSHLMKKSLIAELSEEQLQSLLVEAGWSKSGRMVFKLASKKHKKIIGVTITGASINHDLLHHIGPSVVIVEEAAEILEPSLLAALTPSLEHLILIGDHKQLRPQVDTYDLRRNFQFDKSMMERLIDAKFPYKTLTKQNRMRPEFSALLKDIYPRLKDNLSLVLKNEPLKCIAKSMFFWSHQDPEKKDRTFTNAKEAERIVALVLYLLWSGCRPSEITVLAAYLGQTKLLRNLMKKAKAKRPTLFQEIQESGEEKEGFIQVQTIDMFQGDENEYVLVSLVRSNDRNNIGFLKELNRRCVAQSRAKCGMYFVGNMNLLMNAKLSCWGTMINGMNQQECTGTTLPLQCSKHATSRCDVLDADQAERVIDNPKLLCREKCDDLYPCHIHRCKRPCLPRHNHGKCVEIVLDIFPKCRHLVRRKCQDDISELLCKKEVGTILENCGHEVMKECHQRNSDILCDELVTAIFPKCGHETEKKCYVNIEEMSCERPCEEYNSCGIHRCVDECGKPHSHDSCPKMIDFRFPGCNHPSPTKKKCSKPIVGQCNTTVHTTGLCGHPLKKLCYQQEYPPCTHQCEMKNSCGIHRCDNKCGKIHDHDKCQKLIDYKFPGCDHPSPKKKRCSEPISWNCTSLVYFNGSCGHLLQKQCYQKNADVKCTIPCGKTRKCGHPCTNVCRDDCEKGDCKHCLDLYTEKMKKFHEDAKKRVKDLEDKIKKNPSTIFSIDEISSTGPDSAEYQKVNDKVVKFVQPMHNWFPKVTKIEKVTNYELEKKFEIAKSKAFGDHIDENFHGTDDNGVRGITKDGFRMPDPNPPTNKRGMYGQGIYFATDSSKSAQKIYTKGSQKLLLCQVILGKSKEVHQADYTLNKQRLRSERCDSVYAPRGSAVKNDEFVIFDPDQALPQYIIHFSTTGKSVPPSPTPLTTQPFLRKKMQPSRAVNFTDPFQIYYNIAESHFRRMAAMANLQSTISSIDIVINKDLERKFEAKKSTFKLMGIPDDEILAYHGTDKANIDSILKTNLQLSFARRQAHGRGNYFSEFPNVSLGYGDGLILCRVLPGKEFVDSGRCNIPPGYNSKKVMPTNQPGAPPANASGAMIIIECSDQILPFFVIHR
ncbi:NFX1-type zinc finger-containing protein 1-like [Dendronephthya gigantea]|uniref:NFX1-type zinc finger-containing protein 1-like n=1 Tax=Dendronephthya gigantea TaxID=151771 RepID=UPI00106A737A|nr:NFX1-type zinc finger-containing protein 1-like [Dendronephthya gigantea]